MSINQQMFGVHFKLIIRPSGTPNNSSIKSVINLSTASLKLSTDSWTSLCDEVCKSLEEYGCFAAVYDQIDPLLQTRVFQVLKDLFDLPTETKLRNISELPFHGYIEHKAMLPVYESLGIERSTFKESIHDFTNLMWPSGNQLFSETIHAYSNRAAELEQLVVRMVCESYGIKEYNERRHKKNTDYLLRVMKYRVPKHNESNAGLMPHTDKSFLTILNQNQVSGLEVMTKEGDWISYHPCPSSFFVMAGDAALAWSNGRIHSAQHRVSMRSNIDRYSTGLFSINRGIIEVPEKLIDDKHKRRFNSFDHYDLLRFSATIPVSRENPCTATAYCGT